MNKGRKFFSILLTIIITITIALISFLAYKYISNYILTKEASDIVIGSIQIPKTKVKYPIVNSAEPAAMDTAIVMLYGPGLNEEGNTVIVGHNYRNGGFFGNNKKLENGDKIYITDSKRK